MTEILCPVCGEKFDNEQGKGGHVASLKDAAHVAFRTLGTVPAKPGEPSPPPSPQPARQPPPEPLVQSPSPAADAAPSPASAPASVPEPSSPAASPLQQEAEPALGFLAVAFDPPEQIQPLAANPQAPGTAAPGASGPGSGKPSVIVPLEPILAGSTAAALNGLFLNRPVDAQVTLQQVRETGFPTAAEACVRFYYPDLPLDHPVTALLLSGANLAMLVAACRGKYEGQARPPGAAPPAQAATSPADKPPEPQAQVPVAPREGPTGTTGDPYWDTILANAGGVAL